MAYELNDGQGSLFKNTHKKGDDNKPGMTGQVKVVCPHCQKSALQEIASWKKVDKNGNPWLSLKVQEPRDDSHQPDPPADEDIPF